MKTPHIFTIVWSMLGVMACGDDAPVRTTRGTGFSRPSTPSTSTSTATPAKTQDPVTCRPMPSNLVAAEWDDNSILVDKAKSNTLRDPFTVAGEHLADETSEVSESDPLQLRSVVDGYEVAELKFTMAITGQPPVFAVLRDPSGFGHDVYIGDIVGNKPRMRVEAITSNEILFSAVERIGGDEQSRELKKTLLTQEELQEFFTFQ